MKIGDVVHLNVDYLTHIPLRTGIVLCMKDGMVSMRILGGSTVLTVRASILEVFSENAS